jgi:molecular chaperone IbpA
MNSYDFSPLFRTAIGFDHLAALLESASRRENSGYPPYNIELIEENRYRITMALAGFAEEDIEIEIERQSLKVSGKKPEKEGDRRYLHRGIALRSFEKQFELAEHVEVVGASMRDGMLNIELQRRIPEALKPRKIAISREGEMGQKRLIEGLSQAA